MKLLHQLHISYKWLLTLLLTVILLRATVVDILMDIAILLPFGLLFSCNGAATFSTMHQATKWKLMLPFGLWFALVYVYQLHLVPQLLGYSWIMDAFIQLPVPHKRPVVKGVSQQVNYLSFSK